MIPILFVHYGWSEELALVLAQVRRTNPSAEIVLLTDSTEHKLEGIECVPYQDLFAGAEEFAKLYYHHSVYSEEFERFCFQRWFIIRDYMRARGLNSAIHLDSDVLVFSDLAEAFDPFRDCDFTLSYGRGGYCGHSMLINSREAIELFCGYALEMFSEKNQRLILDVQRDRTLELLNLKKELIPLNDMRLLGRFRENWEFIVGETTAFYNDSTFDHYIASPQSGFEMAGEIKRFQWQDGRPFCHHRRLNRLIRFHTIHLQGGWKRILGELIRLAQQKQA